MDSVLPPNYTQQAILELDMPWTNEMVFVIVIPKLH
jgi:hypothetical protein